MANGRTRKPKRASRASMGITETAAQKAARQAARKAAGQARRAATGATRPATKIKKPTMGRGKYGG